MSLSRGALSRSDSRPSGVGPLDQSLEDVVVAKDFVKGVALRGSHFHEQTLRGHWDRKPHRRSADRREVDDPADARPRLNPVYVGCAQGLAIDLELFAHEQLLTTSGAGARPCAVGARMGWHHASATLWHQAFGSSWTQAFTFALVRNPWARLVSHWAFHLASRSPLDGDFLTPEQRRIAKVNESASKDYFRAWVRHARRSFQPDSRMAWQFTTVDGHGNEHVSSFNASQLSWLVDATGRALLVDDVIRLEDLEQRWPYLQ